MREKFITCLLFLTLKFLCQPEKLDRPEIHWALLHPVAAIKVKNIYKSHQFIYKTPSLREKLDTFSMGGTLDAFRHVYFMAAFAQKIKTGKLKKLGIAHEKSNFRSFQRGEIHPGFRHDSLSMVMDLLNNDLGLRLGKNFPDLNKQELAEKVILSIQAGEAIIVRRNHSGDYTDCEGIKLNLDIYIRKWFIPLCLVKSNHDFKN